MPAEQVDEFEPGPDASNAILTPSDVNAPITAREALQLGLALLSAAHNLDSSIDSSVAAWAVANRLGSSLPVTRTS
jgi:hypothetical protein